MSFEVPCPHEGSKEACDRCWASHSDATPYCTSETYKKKRAQQRVQQREPLGFLLTIPTTASADRCTTP